MSFAISKPITIMGANASGKTGLALELAKRTDGEVISADSKQIYKHLSAGTSKPEGTWKTVLTRELYLVDDIPYHMVDTVDPKSAYDAGTFATEAKALMNSISATGRTPIIAGGTGMYIQALWNGLDQLPPADPDLRKEMAAFAGERGKDALHAELAALDPKAAAMIPPGNIQRVMRALEITKLAGRPVSELWTGRFGNALPGHLGTFVFLKWDKELLSGRIKSRTVDAFDAWVEETRRLLERGYPEDAPGLKSLGYPQVMDFISGRLTRAEAIHSIVGLSMAYAKRQNTWFGRYKNALLIELRSPEDYDVEQLAEAIIRAGEGER